MVRFPERKELILFSTVSRLFCGSPSLLTNRSQITRDSNGRYKTPLVQRIWMSRTATPLPIRLHYVHRNNSPICLSVSSSKYNNSAPTGRILMKLNLWFLENLSRKFKFNWSIKIMTDNLLEDLCTFMIISGWILFRIRNVADKIVEKIKTCIPRSLFSFENCAVYEIMWKNIVQSDRPCALYVGYLRLQAHTQNI